ncbi:MAG: c-type cytochrome [Blastocatellia bacterium]
MKKIVNLKLFVLSLGMAAVAGYSAMTVSVAGAAPLAAADGAAVYASKCAKCHGADGKGVEKYKKQGVKDLTDKTYQKTLSLAKVTKAITAGKGEMMPAWKDKLSADEIKAVAATVKAFGK